MANKVIIRRGKDGYYVARCPALKGCWSQGKTRREALKNIRQAIGLYLQPSKKDRTDFVSGVRKGLRELDAGKGIPHERVKLESPAWHKKILDERRKKVAEGRGNFLDLETLKSKVRRKGRRSRI